MMQPKIRFKPTYFPDNFHRGKISPCACIQNNQGGEYSDSAFLSEKGCSRQSKPSSSAQIIVALPADNAGLPEVINFGRQA